MNPRQIELIRLNINIITAWIQTLEFTLRHSFVKDEPPLRYQIANYKNLVTNLENVLTLEKEKPNEN